MFSFRLVIIFYFINIVTLDSEHKGEDEDLRSKRATACTRLQYREIDGSCNNANNPEWGKTAMPYTRFLPPDYADGSGEMRRSVTRDGLPGARSVSLHMVRDINNEHPIGSHMVMQWGQLINHDITKKRTNEVSCCDDGMTTRTNNRECHPILLPSDDPFFRKRCFGFSRSDAVNVNGKREQINDVTGFVDASPIYGSKENIARSLRSFNGGKLKSLPRTFGKHLLPLSDATSFSSGDSRTNMIPSLVIAHVLLLREHNRLAENLAQLNPHWNDETLYQEARKIVTALVQKITYGEFLPTIMGSNSMGSLNLLDVGYFNGYDPTLNPTISNGFAVAAYRFGHSLVQSHLKRFTPELREIAAPPLAMEFFNVSSILNRDGEVDRIVLGLINQHTQQADSSFTAQIQHNLFGIGSDLYAINIQRGRDHGIPGYNAWRKFCRFPVFRDFSELSNVMSVNAADTLRKLYANIDDVDFYAAGMAEFPIKGGLVGPTFACVITKQFHNLRHGDRFWFENGAQTSSFTPEQLRQIQKSSLARLICDNTDLIKRMQPRAMHVSGGGNQLISCENIPGIDLRFWQGVGPQQQPNEGFSGNNNIQLNNNVQGSSQFLRPHSSQVTFPPNFPFHDSGPPRQTVQNNQITDRRQNFPADLIRNQFQLTQPVTQVPKPFIPPRQITDKPSPPRGNFPIHRKLFVSSSPANRVKIQQVTSRPFPQQQNDIFEPTIGPLPPGSAVFIPPGNTRNNFGAQVQSNNRAQSEFRNITLFNSSPNRRFNPSRAQSNSVGQQNSLQLSNRNQNVNRVQQSFFPNRQQETNVVHSTVRPGGSNFNLPRENQLRKPTSQNGLEPFGLQQSSKPVHIFFTQGNSRSSLPFTRLKTLRPQPGVVLRVPGLSHVNEKDDAFGYFVTF